MAQRAVEDVIQGFLHSMSLVQQKQEAQKQAEERKAEAEERKREFDAQLKAQQDAASKMWDLRHAELDATQAQHELAATQLQQQTGITPPGATTIPGVQAPELKTPINMMRVSPQSEESDIIPGQAPSGPLVLKDLQNTTTVFPSGRSYTVPPLEQSPAQKLIEHQFNLQQAARLTEEQARQTAEFQREQALATQRNKDYLEIMGRQQSFEKQQQDARIRAENSRAADRNRIQLQLAGLKAGGGMNGFGGTISVDDEGNPVFMPTDPSDIIKSTIDQVRNGQMSMEYAKKNFTPKQWPIIAKSVQDSGNKFLSQKQQDAVASMEHISSLTEDLFKIHNLRLNHAGMLQFPLSDASNEFNTLEEKIGGDLAGVSKWLNSVPRFTNVELGQVKKALLPDKSIFTHTGSMEFTKYEKFVKDVQDSFNTILNDIPEGQRNQIRDRLGLNSFPYLGSAIKTPGASVNSIQGASQPSPQVGGKMKPPKPGQILVVKKSTGQTGWLDPKDYKEDKYSKVGAGGQ